MRVLKIASAPDRTRNGTVAAEMRSADNQSRTPSCPANRFPERFPGGSAMG